MSVDKQLAQYFKENKGYNRLLKGMKNKYISLGEIKGNVVINNPEKIEKQALSGLMKKDYASNKSISINLKILQQRIENSKFAGANLKEVLEEYFQESLTTKKEGQGQYQTQISQFFEEILEQNKNEPIYEELKEIIHTQNGIYQNWKKHYNKDKEELKIALQNACKGMNYLPDEKIRIPVFASQIAGNPHAFDKSTLCGKLFIMLLCNEQNSKVPQNTEELSELYYRHNLLIDDVSNMILCKNIEGYTKTNEYIENGQTYTEYDRHLGLKGFAYLNEPIYLNLYNLSSISFLAECQEYNKVVVMENPAVFMEVSERCTKQDFPLVCTYGQVKLSGLILLDMLVEKDYQIYYSGDIDPEGIQIADKLKSRYKKKLKFLGFDVNTYEQNLSNVVLPESRLRKLEKIEDKTLKEVANVLKVNKKASYEEAHIQDIIAFIEREK